MFAQLRPFFFFFFENEMMGKVNDSLRLSTQAHQGSWELIPMLHMVLFLSLNAFCMQITNTNYKQTPVADYIDKGEEKKRIKNIPRL